MDLTHLQNMRINELSNNEAKFILESYLDVIHQKGISSIAKGFCVLVCGADAKRIDKVKIRFKKEPVYNYGDYVQDLIDFELIIDKQRVVFKDENIEQRVKFAINQHVTKTEYLRKIIDRIKPCVWSNEEYLFLHVNSRGISGFPIISSNDLFYRAGKELGFNSHKLNKSMLGQYLGYCELKPL